MKGLRKIIIAFISLIIILLITMIFILRKNGNASYIFGNQEINESEDEQINDGNIIQISDYFVLKSCVQGYIDSLDKTSDIYYTIEENGERKYDSKLQKQSIYSFLSSSYIKDNNITENNIDKYVKLLNEKYRFYPIEIKNLNNNNTLATFKVKGIIQNLEYKNATRIYCIVNVDYTNRTFSIQQMEEKQFEEYKNVTNSENSIKSNGNNIFNTTNIDVQKVSLEYLQLYKFLTLANPEITYNMMTEEYRNKRFGNLDNYKQYIKDNYDEFKGINASAYLTKNTDNAVQYVIKDQYQNLYIFDVKSTMNYTIKLDTYTIEEENFTTTYAGADESQRVQMNIGKFFDMINRHDYITSYRCLDDTFKKNNMKSQQEFENTIKNSLFKFNKYELNELKSIGSKTYECQLYVSDSIDSASDRIKMTIIMQLQEDRNFVMSFSMN